MPDMAMGPVIGQRLGGAATTPPRHIVILNWRDIKNPQGGGAEKVTHEIARRWVNWGHRVTLFCASYPDASAEDVIDGVRVVRRGRQHTVHWEAYRYYSAHLRGRCDIVVDEVNTIPFFAPLYAREPVLMFSHQLAREIWRYEAPFPLSTMGYAAEPIYLQAYRQTPIMTVSASTEESLRRVGLPGPYYLIPEAVDTRAPDALPALSTKDAALTLVFVGRVVPSKRVDHIIRALALIHRSGYPGTEEARLWIIGSYDDEHRRMLDALIAARGLSKYVRFWGRVDEATKEQLLGRARLRDDIRPRGLGASGNGG